MMKRVAILGSTGSIGQNALKVIEHLKEGFQVTALAARSNIDLLEKQALAFKPELIAVWDETAGQKLQKRLPHLPVLGGVEGILAVATHDSTHLVLSAMSSFEGVLPTLKAIEAGKDVALANKEALVAAGPLVLNLVKKKKTQLIPVDSEHTAILQCLKGENLKEVRRIILTASGGPFREFSLDQLAGIGKKEALNHPNYRMGSKVTIDSSTLMNKGLEMIEAAFLYEMPLEKIEVVIHPEQVIHSMVEFVDGSIMAQMGEPNMLFPIQVALTHPVRYPGILKPFDFTQTFALRFSKWDEEKFRCLKLAYQALKEGGSMPCFMNAANEVLVGRFLNEEIGWLDIGKKLGTLMNKHHTIPLKNYDELAGVDLEGRALAQRI